MYYRYIHLVILILCAYYGAKEAASCAVMRERAFFTGGKGGRGPTVETPGIADGFGTGGMDFAHLRNPIRAA